MATKKRAIYPAECPAFEVIGGAFESRPIGFHFDGFPFWHSDGADSAFPIRADDGTPSGFPFMASEVRPLTRAAREMLAIVMSRK